MICRPVSARNVNRGETTPSVMDNLYSTDLCSLRSRPPDVKIDAGERIWPRQSSSIFVFPPPSG